MNKSLEAMKRVIIKRQARGASDKDIQECIKRWLSIHKNAEMRAAIQRLK